MHKTIKNFYVIKEKYYKLYYLFKKYSKFYFVNLKTIFVMVEKIRYNNVLTTKKILFCLI